MTVSDNVSPSLKGEGRSRLAPSKSATGPALHQGSSSRPAKGHSGCAEPNHSSTGKQARSMRTGEPFVASGTPGDLTWLEDFLTSNDLTPLAPFLRWCRH